jgi:hypothetical protein
MAELSEILKEMKSNSNTVNSNKYIANSNTVNSNNSSNTVSGKKSFKEEFDSLLEKYSIKPDGLAIHLAELLDDLESLRYYQILLREHSEIREQLFEWAHYAKAMDEQGKLSYKRAAYFQGILKKHNIKKKFKKDS